MCFRASPLVNVGMTESLDRKNFAEFRAVMQVDAADRVGQLEVPAVWQRLAPQELVIPAKSWAMRVRVFSRRRISSEVERGIDQHVRALTQ